jgi:hypothetical protein
VSLAWWAKKIGARTDLADLIFTTKTTTFNGQSVSGLGFNIARYNVGACSTNKYSVALTSTTAREACTIAQAAKLRNERECILRVVCFECVQVA